MCCVRTLVFKLGPLRVSGIPQTHFLRNEVGICSFYNFELHFLGAFAKAKSDYLVRHVCPSAWNISAPTGRLFLKFDIRAFFEQNLPRKFKFH